MRKTNSGFVVVEALLIMSVVAIIGLVNTNKNLEAKAKLYEDAYVSCEDEVEEIENYCENLESFIEHSENRKHER